METPPPSPPPLATATAEAPPPPDVQIQSQKTPSETPPSHCQTENTNKAMANFKAFVMAIAASNPRRPLTPPLKTLIQNRFTQFFPDSHTPDHPTYAAMIIAALGDLNEEGGSSEESISKFIKNKYDDLPRAHSTFLKLHLWKLCESGEIHVTGEKCYLLGDIIIKSSPGENDEVIVEQYQVEEQRDEARKVQNQAIILDDAVGCGGSDEKTREQKLQTSVIEERKQPEEEQNDVSKGQTLGQQIEVIEGKGISLEQQSGVIMELDKWQKQEIKLPENRSQMEEHQTRVVEGLSWSQIHKQLQQEQEKPHPGKLLIRLRRPIPESSTIANVYESFPLDHCHDKEPAETVLHAFTKILSPTNQQCQNEQQQPIKRRRGRPPKPKPEADETSGLLLNSSDQQQKYRARGRPQKCKSSTGQPRQRRRGRPPKLRQEADETTGLSLNSSFQHNPLPQMQQEKNRVLGRPQKCKSSTGQPRQRRRGRPPKLRQEADETTGLSLNSSFQHNPLPQMQQEKNRVLGRTPKCKSSAGGDMEIHKISSNSSVQVGEGHESWTQKFNNSIMASISEET